MKTTALNDTLILVGKISHTMLDTYPTKNGGNKFLLF